jgi:2-polyprenyl-3-methyl-5-hydroxy-6-metoxy-1,4-benzoquinol methylase
MDAVSDRPRRWNHNLHYHRVILDAVPAGCRRSLDVRCGEGVLARDLSRVVAHVTAIDCDAASIDVARRHDDGGGVEYVAGDFMSHPFEPASFDHIASIAALHHMDAAAALERMRALPAPGGTLAPATFAETRRLAGRLLPGVRYRRLVLWRYALVWTKPA